MSLIKCLLTGPNLNPDMMSVLIRFRLHEIAYIADIKKAFLRDRDAVRFLWFIGPPTEEKDEKLRMLRMTRVVFGASSRPFLLAATIRKHFRQYEQEHPKEVETSANHFMWMTLFQVQGDRGPCSDNNSQEHYVSCRHGAM